MNTNAQTAFSILAAGCLAGCLIPSIRATAGTPVSIPARGGIITDAPAADYTIDHLGTTGDITPAAPEVSAQSLTQAFASEAAAVDLLGGRLALEALAVAQGGNALTVANGALTAPLAPAATGVPRVRVIRNDAATGISLSKDYTHLMSFGATAATVNGVAFPAITATSGTFPGKPYGWANAPANQAAGYILAETVDSGNALSTLVQSMRYTPSGGPSSVTLTGLTDGESYELTFFTRHWSDFSWQRLANLTFITDGSGVPTAPFTFNTEGPSVTVITFRYTLTGTNAVTLTLANIGSEPRTLHLYALTNERLAPLALVAPTPNTLTLANREPSVPLTVRATLADNANPVNLAKDGPGEVRIGPVDTTGIITLLTDGLVFDTPFGATNALTALPILRLTGPGNLTKDGQGLLSIYGVSDYAGPTTVAQGTLRIGGPSPLGTNSVTVLNNAALDIGGGDTSAGGASSNIRKYMLDGPRTVTIRGAGPDGNGAYVNNSSVNQAHATTAVVLAGDATVGTANTAIPALNDFAGRLDILSQGGGTFRLNGHTLTKKGNNLLGAGNGTLDTTGGGTFDIRQGSFLLHDAFNTAIASTILGDASTTVNLADNTRFVLDRFNPPIPWAFTVGSNVRFSVFTPGINTISGPVTLSGDITVEGSTVNSALTLSGPVSGSLTNKLGNGTLILTSAANAYSGDALLISGGTLRATVANALPSAVPVTVGAAGRLELGYTTQTLPDLTLNGGLAAWGGGGDLTVTGSTTAAAQELMPFAGIVARSIEAATLSMANALVAADTLTAQALDKHSGGNATLAVTNATLGAITVSGGTLTVDDLTLEDVFRIGRPLLWYDTTDPASIVTNASGYVTTLRNKGSLGATADAAAAGTNNGTNSFTLATAPNGLTVIRKAADPYATLVTPSADANYIGISGTAPRTLVVAARRLASNRALQVHYGPNANGRSFGLDLGTTLAFYTYNNDFLANAGESLDFRVLTHASGGEGNPMLRQGWLDGEFAGQRDLASFDTGNGRFFLFARDSWSNTQGDIGEVFFFDRTLSDPERRALERHLSAKWRGVAPTPVPALAPGTDVTLVPTPRQDTTAAVTFPLDDATSGISTNKHYTHVIDFGNNGASKAVNGVTFTPVWNSNPQAGVTMTANGTRTGGNPYTSQIQTWSKLYSLCQALVYNVGDDAVTLIGLTPGQAYELTLFNRPWNSDPAFANRRITLNFTNGTAGDLLTFNNECALVQAVTWRYIAAGTSVTLALRNVTGSLTRHFYALTNEVLPPTASDGSDLLPTLNLGSRPETIRNLTGSGTVTGNGVTLTVTGDIATPSVIHFDGAAPVFNGATYRVAPDSGQLHINGSADLAGLTIAAALDANLRGAHLPILTATGGITALPALDPSLRPLVRLVLSEDRQTLSLAPTLGTVILVK